MEGNKNYSEKLKLAFVEKNLSILKGYQATKTQS